MAEEKNKQDVSCENPGNHSQNKQASSDKASEQFEMSEMLKLLVEYVCIDKLKGYNRHTRRYSKKQLKKLRRGIIEFGFIIPVLVDHANIVIAGHARIMVAKRLGMAEVPAIRLDHLSDAQVKAFRIFDNRIAEEGEWDPVKLALEFRDLVDVSFDVTLTGFEMPEVDLVIGNQLASVGMTPEDQFPTPDTECEPVTRLGDLWLLDEHRVHCGDARDKLCYENLLGSRWAQQVITDVPYNVAIQGHVRVSKKSRRKNFVMASGEMSKTEFAQFLNAVIENLALYSEEGSVHHLFIDWRHIAMMTTVCERHYDRQLNMCVWVKANGGMGSLYRSQHELVLVFKHGTAPHINNVELGRHGRNRTNVWPYNGVNAFGPNRQQNLNMHPTVKPVAMIADAILDCSTRGGIILDPFLGSGTMIIAAEKTGRVGYGMELDPHYVDVIVRRWQEFTGGEAILAGTGMIFSEVAAVRNSSVPLLPPPTAHQEGRQSDE
jgi:DNA modification methylase